MKKLILVIVLIAMALCLYACSRAMQKEYDIVDGKSVLKNEIEYNRVGDQKLSGLSLHKVEPNGVEITVGLDTQESEGKLQIEGVLAALAEVIASLQSQGLAAEAAQLQNIATNLAATNN